jgi:ketosteroid isomerase-like protein
MDETEDRTAPAALVARLQAATNAHDIDAIVACFASGYRNETPAHPGRGFVGREQVRKNWEQILVFIPDLEAQVTCQAVDGQTIWTEWEHRGTRRDGTRHLMRGIIIFGVVGGLADWARFYLEPVEDGAGGVDDAVRRQVSPGGPN